MSDLKEQGGASNAEVSNGNGSGPSTRKRGGHISKIVENLDSSLGLLEKSNKVRESIDVDLPRGLDKNI